MTVIEMRTMETICSNLPRISSMLGRIANEMKRIVDEIETKTCCICGKSFKGYGHNPHPLKDEGVCCDKCNNKVLVERVYRTIRKRDSEIMKGE